MINQELETLLLEKKADLIKELTAIDILLGLNDGKVFEHNKSTDVIIKQSKISGELKSTFGFSKVSSKKESEIWKDYIFNAMKTLGGKIKSREIADVIISANKNITPNRVISVTRDKLAELVKENLIIVHKDGLSRKTGYEYEILDKL